jgi:hypothetical protein
MDPSSADRDALVNADNDVHDITIRDLLIEGAPRTEPPTDPNSTRSYRGGYNRGGIVFRSLKDGQMKNITLQNITVQNCTYNGVFISGAAKCECYRLRFYRKRRQRSAGAEAAAQPVAHPLHRVNIKDSRLDTSPFGSGICAGSLFGCVRHQFRDCT